MASDKLSGLRPVPALSGGVSSSINATHSPYFADLAAFSVAESCEQMLTFFFLSQNPCFLRSQSSGAGQCEELFHGAPVREGDEPAVFPEEFPMRDEFLVLSSSTPSLLFTFPFPGHLVGPYAPSIDAQQREKSINQCCCVLAKGTFQWAGI